MSLTTLRKLISWTRQPSRNPIRSFRPGLECLEERQVPTVTWHGGPVLPNVEIEALYYGNDWFNHIATDYQMKKQLDGYLQNIVNSSYMDMLTNAGYNVGRGDFERSYISLTAIDKRYPVTDRTIQQALQKEFYAGHLLSPDGNRLYVVYVEDNVRVTVGNDPKTGTPIDSTNTFLGYHSAFDGLQADGHHSARIRYAVMPYPGGVVTPYPGGVAKNASVPGLGTFDTLTEVTSHELAEAVTDPDVSFGAKGWYDDNPPPGSQGEIGDLANLWRVYLNGYCVQRIAEKNDQPMTPAGATSSVAASFVLTADDTLYVVHNGGAGVVSRGIHWRISDQGIDNEGHAMVDLLTPDGHAVEYHDVSGLWVDLGWGVMDAKAGQGVSYVLSNDFKVREYYDAGGEWRVVTGGFDMIDAGTDKYGVNSVYVANDFRFMMVSDSDGVHLIGFPIWFGGVKAISAGQHGFATLLTPDGHAFLYSEVAGAWVQDLAENVTQVTIGTDPAGQFQIEMLLGNDQAWEYQASTGQWNRWFAGQPGITQIESISKAQAGAVALLYLDVDLVFAYEHDAPGHLYAILPYVSQEVA